MFRKHAIWFVIPFILVVFAVLQCKKAEPAKKSGAKAVISGVAENCTYDNAGQDCMITTGGNETFGKCEVVIHGPGGSRQSPGCFPQVDPIPESACTADNNMAKCKIGMGSTEKTGVCLSSQYNGEDFHFCSVETATNNCTYADADSAAACQEFFTDMNGITRRGTGTCEIVVHGEGGSRQSPYCAVNACDIRAYSTVPGDTSPGECKVVDFCSEEDAQVSQKCTLIGTNEIGTCAKYSMTSGSATQDMYPTCVRPEALCTQEGRVCSVNKTNGTCQRNTEDNSLSCNIGNGYHEHCSEESYGEACLYMVDESSGQKSFGSCTVVGHTTIDPATGEQMTMANPICAPWPTTDSPECAGESDVDSRIIGCASSDGSPGVCGTVRYGEGGSRVSNYCMRLDDPSAFCQTNDDGRVCTTSDNQYGRCETVVHGGGSRVSSYCAAMN